MKIVAAGLVGVGVSAAGYALYKCITSKNRDTQDVSTEEKKIT